MKLTRIFDILESALEEFPDKPDALVSKENGKWSPISYKEYYEAVQKLSCGLLALGLKKGDLIVTISNNRPEWNYFDMAMSQTGIIHVPVYTTLSESDYEYILNHCAPRLLLLSDKALFERLTPIAQKIKTIEGIYTFNPVSEAKNWNEIAELGEKNKNKFADKVQKIKQQIQSDDLATIIYTSGTTGNPKGVMLSHKNILSNMEGISEVFHFDQTDSMVSFLPICHIFERTTNYYFQLCGITISYAENLGTISNDIKEIQPTVFIAVPRVLENIFDKILSVGRDLKGMKKQIFFWAVRLGLHYRPNRRNGWYYHFWLSVADKLVYAKWRKAIGGHVKIIVTGSAAMQPRLIRIFNAAGIPVIEGYGMSETSPVIAVNNLYTGEVMIGTVGPVLPGMSVKIAEDGEILVKGNSVMKGYYKDPQTTSEVFDSDGWFHTGDVGVLVSDKFVKITDRKKEMFKLSSGKYVAPQIIENKLKESSFIDQVMVIGENEKFASALIVPNSSTLLNWCKHHGINPCENKDLVKDPKIVAQFQREVNEMNKNLGQAEQIKRFRLVADEWSQQSGLLSPTLKLKRKELYKKYKDLIADIYTVQKG